MAKIIVIKRDYWNERKDHRPYRSRLHDTQDQSLDLYEAITTILADIADGDEIEISATKTGKRPFGDRLFRYQQPQTYGPETDEQMAARLKKKSRNHSQK